MQRWTRRRLHSAVLLAAAGVAAMSTGATAAGQAVEPADVEQAMRDATGGDENVNPGTVCDNQAMVGTLWLAPPCFDGSQLPPVEPSEARLPTPASAIPAPAQPYAGDSPTEQQTPVEPPPPQFGGQDVNQPIVINDLVQLRDVAPPADGDVPALAALDTASHAG